jgi:hypothetical protein
MCVGTATSNRDQTLFGLKHIAIAGNDQGMIFIRHGKHGLKPAKHAIRAPFFGKLDCGTQQVPLVLLELGFKMLEQSKSIGGTACKTRQNFVVVKTPYFSGRTFDHDMPQGNLPVTTKRDVLTSAY